MLVGTAHHSSDDRIEAGAIAPAGKNGDFHIRVVSSACEGEAKEGNAWETPENVAHL
ncbi:hypothetical protein DB31_3769 [Hyalangium minutum]|uniref:Uncharacterized protein n=1 Tax=Hyalangium minutum TaxID=394096 RepID=A0A085W4P2_9BACT|nr:hypothetical protein DB31_3769 [Hyalangium minutum]